MQMQFTGKAQTALTLAEKCAKQLKQGYVGTEHILMALLSESDCIAVKLLTSLGANVQKIYEDMLTMLGEGEKTAGSPAGMGAGC